MSMFNPNMLERLGYPTYRPTFRPIGFTDEEKRLLAWVLKHTRVDVCVNFQNTDRGLECTARNCPCELLYEADV